LALAVVRKDFSGFISQVPGGSAFIVRLLNTPMKTFIILFLLCSSLYAADTTNSASSDKRIVEVTFARDDKPPTQEFHIVMTLWLSEQNRGFDRDVYSWAHQGGSGPDPDTHKKAAESLKLLRALDEPKVLPDSPNQIVTVRCANGDKWVVKRFPIDKVPAEVHQILTIMGFHDEEFSRLTFIKKAA
jgi:hypothetical protein